MRNGRKPAASAIFLTVGFMTWTCPVPAALAQEASAAVAITGIAIPATPIEFDAEAIFLEVWNAVNDRFYRADFNGVDWGAAKEKYLPRARAATSLESLAPTIKEMLALLNTSHTGFYTKFDPEYYFLFDIFATGHLRDAATERFKDGRVQFEGIGIFTSLIDGRYFVSGVVDGSPAAEAGLVRGNLLVSADGADFHPIKSFAGRAGQTVELVAQFTGDASSRKTLSVVPQIVYPQESMLAAMENSMRLIEFNGKKIAYVHVWSYAGRQFHDRLAEEALRGSFQQADALIVDLRDGWGGASPEYLNLFNQRVPQLKSYSRDNSEIYLDSQWRKPVALVINGGSRSGKEAIAFGFRKYKIGPVIGERTAGAFVAGTTMPIGTDSLLYLAVMGMTVDGEVLEGAGVEPDFRIDFPLPFATRDDPQIDKALEVLSGAISK